MTKQTKQQPAEPTRAASLVQIFDNATLVDVAAGRVDLNTIARLELANRGLNRSGQWIGFAAADAEAATDLARMDAPCPDDDDREHVVYRTDGRPAGAR